jgi:hypothetical protein
MSKIAAQRNFPRIPFDSERGPQADLGFSGPGLLRQAIEAMALPMEGVECQPK